MKSGDRLFYAELRQSKAAKFLGIVWSLTRNLEMVCSPPGAVSAVPPDDVETKTLSRRPMSRASPV